MILDAYLGQRDSNNILHSGLKVSHAGITALKVQVRYTFLLEEVQGGGVKV